MSHWRAARLSGVAGWLGSSEGWESCDSASRGPTWATGLLDLGEAGVEALVERLKGPRGRLYVLALFESTSVLPLPVAEALCDLLDASRPAQARHELLVTLWRSAPAQAASALAAAKGRLEPADRPAVDVVLEVVRHRAAR